MTTTRIAAGDLSAEVNTQERNGWCGLAKLRNDKVPEEWLLSPAFTLEHYIGVPRNEPGYVGYEPCESRKSLVQVEADACTLMYEPTPCSQLACAIHYKMTGPNIVDVMVIARTARANWPFGSLALFFATIVKAPLLTGVHMRAVDVEAKGKKGDGWLHFNGMASTPGNTAHPYGVDHPELGRPSGKQGSYFYSDSSIRFKEPLFVGQVEGKALAVMFPRRYRKQIRITVNPVAPAFGGPAWDFFWVIEDPIPDQDFRIDFRAALGPFAGLKAVLADYVAYCSLTGSNE